MSKWFFPDLAVMLLIAFILNGCSHKDVDYWQNGLKKSEITYRCGKINGAATWWYMNGNKQQQTFYRRGVLQGKSTRWYYSGSLQSEVQYSGGLRNGLTTNWDEEGHRMSEENYTNDTLNGPYRLYFAIGQIKVNGFFRMGWYDSTWTYYNENGRKVGEGFFTRGTGREIGYYMNGRISREINYEQNEKNGEEVWYDENGNKTKVIIYNHGAVKSETEFLGD